MILLSGRSTRVQVLVVYSFLCYAEKHILLSSSYLSSVGTPAAPFPTAPPRILASLKYSLNLL